MLALGHYTAHEFLIECVLLHPVPLLINTSLHLLLRLLLAPENLAEEEFIVPMKAVV